VQKVTEAALRRSEPIPGSHVEIPDAYCPRSFEGRLGVLVRMLVELVAKGYSPESKVKLRFVDLPRAVIHQKSPFLRSEQNNEQRDVLHDEDLKTVLSGVGN
jgi:hypothetical protein